MKTQTLQITVTVPEAENGTTCIECPLLEICTLDPQNTQGVQCNAFDLASWTITEVKPLNDE